MLKILLTKGDLKRDTHGINGLKAVNLCRTIDIITQGPADSSWSSRHADSRGEKRIRCSKSILNESKARAVRSDSGATLKLSTWYGVNQVKRRFIVEWSEIKQSEVDPHIPIESLQGSASERTLLINKRPETSAQMDWRWGRGQPWARKKNIEREHKLLIIIRNLWKLKTLAGQKPWFRKPSIAKRRGRLEAYVAPWVWPSFPSRWFY